MDIVFLLYNGMTVLDFAGPHEVLVIPGSGSAAALRQYPDILKWVRSIHANTTWTTSICTGSLILGAAGLLAGKKATTHWAAYDRLKNRLKCNLFHSDFN